ncbi:family 43 glycosylhydrolase [Desertivirga brevis]|uniref:family 43 glycosylhydrolase n=1 Tax=Desertivirga brevis TaxID=2810310 RepID=UPI001A97AD43|nr:family 43 glycosylhydrolase [Pedobacter sp. SYSU D00873]
MFKNIFRRSLSAILVLLASTLFAQNPFITNQFTADPTARVFGDRVYVYPSHDIPPAPGKGRPNWFVMEDYHVFSSGNLVDWTDHGMIVHQNKVPWVKPESYSMWAPDCIYRNGKYYFYFPSTPADTNANGKGFTIGVAVADKPTGPFVPQATPIKNVKGIDPNVFIDKDGQAYLYWSQGNIYGAKLKENMLELASEPIVLQDLPTKGLKEGPFLFERNGIYYMTYPHVENRIERLEYAVGNNPLGPFKFAGVIMDESPTGCWTNHHSFIQFKNQWYLFYHHNDLSPKFDKNRSIRVDSLFFNEDGTIRKVIPTLRGVGLSNARKVIQIDRYSEVSEQGITVDFLDTASRMKGWKVNFNQKDAWVRYNSVDFNNTNLKKLIIRNLAAEDALLELRADGKNGPLIGQIVLKKSGGWRENGFSAKAPKGVHDLYIIMKSSAPVSVDWLRFQ